MDDLTTDDKVEKVFIYSFYALWVLFAVLAIGIVIGGIALFVSLFSGIS